MLVFLSADECSYVKHEKSDKIRIVFMNPVLLCWSELE